MIFIGIDPGIASGGIAWRHHKLVQAIKIPTTEADTYAAIRIFHGIDAFAVIERVGPMPKQGVKSTWTFSASYHGLRMALIAAGIPFEAIAPGVWQKKMGCLSKGDKNVTKRRAQELFPGLKVTHHVADALLLMEYARRFGANAEKGVS